MLLFFHHSFKENLVYYPIAYWGNWLHSVHVRQLLALLPHLLAVWTHSSRALLYYSTFIPSAPTRTQPPSSHHSSCTHPTYSQSQHSRSIIYNPLLLPAPEPLKTNEVTSVRDSIRARPVQCDRTSIFFFGWESDTRYLRLSWWSHQNTFVSKGSFVSGLLAAVIKNQSQ